MAYADQQMSGNRDCRDYHCCPYPPRSRLRDGYGPRLRGRQEVDRARHDGGYQRTAAAAAGRRRRRHRRTDTPPPPVAPPPPISISIAPPPIQTLPNIPPPAPVVLRSASRAAAAAVRRQRARCSPRATRAAGQTIQTTIRPRAARRKEGDRRLTSPSARTARSRSCSVTGSSGSPDLDEAACDGMKRHARFTPATDGEGNPTTGINQLVYR